MAAKQKVPSIATDIDANQLFLWLCRFRFVTNSLAPFILWFADPGSSMVAKQEMPLITTYILCK